VAGCCEFGDEPWGSCATELVIWSTAANYKARFDISDKMRRFHNLLSPFNSASTTHKCSQVLRNVSIL
jgi:hypothetical protein